MSNFSQEMISMLQVFSDPKEREFIISNLIFALCPRINSFVHDISRGPLQLNEINLEEKTMLLRLFLLRNKYFTPPCFLSLSMLLKEKNCLRTRTSLENINKALTIVFKEHAPLVQNLIQEIKIIHTTKNPNLDNSLITITNLIESAFPISEKVCLRDLIVDKEHMNSFLFEHNLKEDFILDKLFFHSLTYSMVATDISSFFRTKLLKAF